MTFYLTCDNGYGEIHSVISDNCVGTLENVTSWWNNFSDYYTINANKTLTLNFKNYSGKANNWNNFVAVVTNDVERGGTGYAEQVVLRVDDYGWGTYYNHSYYSNNYNWTSFKNDMDGADVELKIRRLNTKVAVKATYTTTSGQKYYQQYVYTSPSGTDPLRVFLTVDNSHITNLASSTADTPAGSNEYPYSVKAIDDNDNELETFASGVYWTGEDDVTVAYPYAIKPDENWYTTSEGTYVATMNASNTSVNITYTKDESIVGFYEGETASGNQSSYSNGAFGTVAGQNKRDRGTAAGTLSPGTYQFVGQLVADGNSGRQITLREGANDPMASLTGSNKTKMATADFTVYTTTGSLYINGANSETEKTNLSTSFDYVLIKRTGDATVSATIGTTGWTTFASAYPLDLANLPSGVSAYYAATDAVGVGYVTVTQKSDEAVAAGTGLLLKGTASETYSIPVAASGTDISSGNLLIGCTSETVLGKNSVSGYNNYVLVNNSGTAEFQSLLEHGATIPEGKAYLQNGTYSAGVKALSIVFEDTATGIRSIDNGPLDPEGRLTPQELTMDDAVFNLAGQRVSQPTRGLYIVNGKKVIVK